MPNPSVPKSSPTARNLIDTLSGSRALSAFVPRIDPHTLKALVDDVGLEDAGPLIAHVSQTQLVHLLDETLWTGARPGDPDKLSVSELLRWLDLWNGLGKGFVADKLYELGDDFCALAFSRLLVVADYDLAPRLLDEHTLAVGRYLVRVRVDDEWDAVQTAVMALWRDFPDFCEAVLARLSFRHSTLRMFGEDDTAGVLDADASHAHAQGRETAGYVTSVMAGAFLRALTAADVDAISAETGYDLQTREYFRRRRQLQTARTTDAASAAGAEADEPIQAETLQTHEADDAQTEDLSTAEQAELAGLEAELTAYQRAQLRPTALLTGPETATVRDSDWLRVALGRLQPRPEVFDRCMDELTYLSNLLMEGVDAGGDRLASGEAANLVIATCNLGACHDLWLEPDDDAVAAIETMLCGEPGLVRLFRIGWHLLANLPRSAAARLKTLFADEVVRARLSAKPWVLREVDGLLGAPDFEETVAARQYEDARETLKILGIALEPEAVVTLCVLTDSVPRFARVLEGEPPEGAVMTYASRNFCTMGDVLAVHRFLDTLDRQVRL
ncbi:MAG: DUF6178 family protein [Pseudomonadales bacterium]